MKTQDIHVIHDHDRSPVITQEPSQGDCHEVAIVIADDCHDHLWLDVGENGAG